MIKQNLVADDIKNNISRELQEEHLEHVCQSTVSRRLKEVGLIDHFGVKKTLIS